MKSEKAPMTLPWDKISGGVAGADVRPLSIAFTQDTIGGPESFVERLLDMGYNAHVLGRPRQGRLF